MKRNRRKQLKLGKRLRREFHQNRIKPKNGKRLDDAKDLLKVMLHGSCGQEQADG